MKKIILILFFLFTPFLALADDRCPDYCAEGILHSRGTVINSRTGECSYASRQVCDYGCDRSGKCAARPETPTEVIPTPTVVNPTPESRPTLVVLPGPEPTAAAPVIKILNTCPDKCEGGTLYSKSSEVNISDMAVGELNDYLIDKITEMVDKAHNDLLELANVVSTATAAETSNVSEVNPVGKEGESVVTLTHINTNHPSAELLNNIANKEGYKTWNAMADDFNKSGSPIQIQAIQSEIQTLVDEGTSVSKAKESMQKKIAQQILQEVEEENESSKMNNITYYKNGMIHSYTIERIKIPLDKSELEKLTERETTEYHYEDYGREIGYTEITVSSSSPDRTQTKTHIITYNNLGQVEKEIIYNHETGEFRFQDSKGQRTIEIKTTKDVDANITQDYKIIVKRGDKEYKIEPRFKELVAKHARPEETIKNVSLGIDGDRPVYVLEKVKSAKIFGLFPVQQKIKDTIDAENLKLIKSEKPWWSIFVVEKKESQPDNQSSSYTCGNGICETGETGVSSNDSVIFFCPYDCGYSGDGVCGADEFYLTDNSYVSYSQDCQAACGNKICEPGESPEICPYDCGPTSCGNQKCEWNESPTICPEDCGTACGNGICDKGESPDNCIADCGSCGDKICQDSEFQGGYCQKDCIPACGNGKCEGGELVDNCSVDCLKCKDCKCGDGKCEGNENLYNCPGDCEKACGDNTCSLFESILSCPQDCKNSCGDGICDGKDLKDNCKVDCSITNCGDGVCSILETARVCSQDCKKTKIVYDGSLYKKDPVGSCGDGICKGTETTINCKSDCLSPCGDGICGSGENSKNCKLECGSLCGNNTCDKDENYKNCPIDCGYCGDGVCNLNKEEYCASDCGVGIACGDNKCGPGESLANCPLDCPPPICGNGVCDATESPIKCPVDCANVCGDNICNKGETYSKCPWDCGYCGDGVCGVGEDKCQLDCAPACGNGVCEKDESVDDCPYDCSG